jgi:alpha-L-fucosidase
MLTRRKLLKRAGILTTIPLIVPHISWSEIINHSIAFETNDIKCFGDGRDWFFKKRFGMFIHWGLYSIPGWHEQHQWRGRIERTEYSKISERWNPDKFNPEVWLDLLEETGMEYICITTKHHDGFCLWDTKLTDFNTMNTPYKKDIIAMLAAACHRRNIPLCLYYSIADWNNPNYPNNGRHHELLPQRQDRPNWNKYMKFLKAQVYELCSNYGEIHGFWWDMNVPEYKDLSINQTIRRLQPNAVINNRGFDDGDFGTPERDFEKDDTISFNKPTEACQSVGIESWGYRKDEDFYTDSHLIRSIDRYLCRDSNYLLNVGPMSDGTIPEESIEILKRIGSWYNSVKESFVDALPASYLTTNRDVMLTSKDKTLYVHLNKDVPGNVVKLKPINVAPDKAILLNDGREIDFVVRFNPSDHSEGKAYLSLINLPVNEFCNTVLVIKLSFNSTVDKLAIPSTLFDGDSGWQLWIKTQS